MRHDGYRDIYKNLELDQMTLVVRKLKECESGLSWGTVLGGC
jgi:hypothetical protein